MSEIIKCRICFQQTSGVFIPKGNTGVNVWCSINRLDRQLTRFIAVVKNAKEETQSLFSSHLFFGQTI